MAQYTTIELQKEYMKFSSGHFTIFSATNREPLHGHNFNVAAAIDTIVVANGLVFDYRYYKHKISDICKTLNHQFLIPTQSPFAKVEETDDMIFVHFNGEKIPFLKHDVLLMPLVNISLEELSTWFIEQLTQDKALLKEHNIQKMVIKVSSAPGQFASSTWVKQND